ncbi:LysR family transcriptional regulator [Streptomyces violaceochromogenes]|uniref:LysR family transcriptional regulator n=1 Tax=Streptomyces violaceochromogenes TaxID=67377 RepID=A0ABU6LMN2_9ACTN|nr:LysR family transcriptional regulator [Streptomyces violaceochromogenes]MEC7050743.1 LysR family transcriptional regulator [Streptomyces violaceochromogenes]GHC94790.1 LysR family transcriptional regulator [Streptomyces violaceochromogenes]
MAMTTDRLNLEGLRYAQAVAETKSFSAAARAYGVTQPALSNGIAKLEERLGDKLFDRSPRGVTPTAFGARILPLIERALVALDAIGAEARRLTEPGEQKIRMGVSPLIGSHLVARAFSMVQGLPAPRDLVLREANMEELRECLLAGQLDIILIPAVAAMPRFEHRVIDVEPIVVVSPDTTEATPVELAEAGKEQFILVPDTCGLTTFTTQLFQAHEMPLNTYPGEAASYQVLEDWTKLGLGSAMVPRSKLTSPDVCHRPLHDQGREVQISFEAVWSADSPLGPDLLRLADSLAAARR